MLPALGSNGPWLDANAHADLLRSMNSGKAWFGPRSNHQGYISVAELQRDEFAWTNFTIRAKRAATAAGFSDEYSGQLIAAIGEFYGNVEEHSQRTDTGYIVFSAQRGLFEFVVADAGIGVLHSLQSNPDYAALNDSGSALENALSEGVSRHYKEAGHGLGFRPLFVGLANISRFMRFRSGDHSRELTRMDDGSIIAGTSQKSQLNGFSCSVLCQC